MTRRRDSQRSKFSRAFAATLNSPPMTFEEAEKFHNRVINSRWWTKQFGENEFVPIPTFRNFSSRKLMLYHLAWYLGDRSEPRHGREFCRNYLAIVRRFMGAEAAATLRTAYKENRVRYSLPKTITPERKAALQAQVLKAREAKVAKVWDRMDAEYEV